MLDACTADLPDAGSPQHRSDTLLLEFARGGDPESCAALVAQYDRILRAFLFRIVGHRDDVDDIAQETWLKVFRHLGNYDSSRPFAPWCFGIGKRVAIDHLRRRKRSVPTLNLSDDEGQSYLRQHADPHDDHAEAALAEEFRTILSDSRMNANGQTLQKYVYEDMSIDDLAESENRSRDTIQWRLSRARHTLRVLWNQREQDSILPPLESAMG
jgi:RNA polymerase sigma-70 factor (ECF subfamily)